MFIKPIDSRRCPLRGEWALLPSLIVVVGIGMYPLAWGKWGDVVESAVKDISFGDMEVVGAEDAGCCT